MARDSRRSKSNYREEPQKEVGGRLGGDLEAPPVASLGVPLLMGPAEA